MDQILFMSMAHNEFKTDDGSKEEVGAEVGDNNGNKKSKDNKEIKGKKDKKLKKEKGLKNKKSLRNNKNGISNSLLEGKLKNDKQTKDNPININFNDLNQNNHQNNNLHTFNNPPNTNNYLISHNHTHNQNNQNQIKDKEEDNNNIFDNPYNLITGSINNNNNFFPTQNSNNMSNLFNININQFHSPNFNNIKGSFGYSYDNADKYFVNNSPSPLFNQEISCSYKSTIFNSKTNNNANANNYMSSFNMNPLSSSMNNKNNEHLNAPKNESNMNIPMSKLKDYY